MTLKGELQAITPEVAESHTVAFIDRALSMPAAEVTVEGDNRSTNYPGLDAILVAIESKSGAEGIDPAKIRQWLIGAAMYQGALTDIAESQEITPTH